MGPPSLDSRYLTAEELDRYAREPRAIRLATYRYRDADPASPPRLGFVIDDGPPAPCVDAHGERVDLYGNTSLAVAALQAQAHELEELHREVAALRESREAALGARALRGQNR
jgi:hypothetical protein